MDYQAFNNASLIVMYESVRGALASDDALAGLGEERRFRVRETPDWKKHAADLDRDAQARDVFRGHRLVRGPGDTAVRAMTR
ncbi:hypothetical protein [Bradyrhizobium sp.]|uniref:hypothetical protein n=1 Tax=Bradyrhizobium sp. TaxID=376 RepID=UPI002736500B|nr:hypothetical protein [Bradyrhizobium sp.]MDP3690690.1 hypothetical protein [Bradyrhizobium sp.]